MDFTLEDLLPADQRLTTVYAQDTASHAIDLLCLHSFHQLPVVTPADSFAGQVVTFESILLSVQAFRTSPEFLLVRDVAVRAESYPPDTDLLRMLDQIQRDSFAIIAEDGHLKGIVTTADATVFFQSYAQDLMVIESIESSLKEAVMSLYEEQAEHLKAVIARVTDRAAATRANLPKAIRTYLECSGGLLSTNLDSSALEQSERRLGLPKHLERLEDLGFNDLIEVLLLHNGAPRLSRAASVSELRELLHRVRDARNKLAHFRGELSLEERRTIRFANEWLENNLPTPTKQALRSGEELPVSQEIPESLQEERDISDAPVGSYFGLAEELRRLPRSVQSADYSFSQIETILGKSLPRSAYEYRAWWANDASKPQSSAWLDEGWRTKAVKMTEKTLTFERTNDRQESYIRFFSEFKRRMASLSPEFPLREASPAGLSWQVLANLDDDNADAATLVASVARGRRFRIEVYIDYDDAFRNAACFDSLLEDKEHIERELGEPLSWERLEHRRACRIAIYTRAQISNQASDGGVLDWGVRQALEMYRVLYPYFLLRDF